MLSPLPSDNLHAGTGATPMDRNAGDATAGPAGTTSMGTIASKNASDRKAIEFKTLFQEDIGRGDLYPEYSTIAAAVCMLSSAFELLTFTCTRQQFWV